MVVIRRVSTGAAFRIYALALDGRCLLLDFLSDLERTNPTEFRRIRALIERSAEHGPPTHNQEQCRHLEELNGFEFKTRGGVRVMAFYDTGRLILCTHGFLKKKQKTPQDELQRAQRWRDTYFKAKQAGHLREETP